MLSIFIRRISWIFGVFYLNYHHFDIPLLPHDFITSFYLSFKLFHWLFSSFVLSFFPPLFLLLCLSFFLFNNRQRLGHDGLYNSTHPPPEFLPGTVIPYEIYRKYRTLLEEKRNLKRELKQYDEDFSRSNGRLPKKSDKEVRTCTCSVLFFHVMFVDIHTLICACQFYYVHANMQVRPFTFKCSNLLPCFMSHQDIKCRVIS